MNPRDPSESIIRILIFGDRYVGKTSLIQTMMNYDLIEPGRYTLFFSRIIEHRSQKINLQIPDMEFYKLYWVLNQNIIKSAQGVIYLYDVTDQQSLDNIASVWANEPAKFIQPKATQVLVANKIDDVYKKVVTTEMGQTLAKFFGIQFFECSVKFKITIKNILSYVLDQILLRIRSEKATALLQTPVIAFVQKREDAQLKKNKQKK